MPSPLTMRFVESLSIDTAEARTPQPTYGIFASSRIPCTVPSSIKTVKDREYHIHRNLLKRTVLCDDQAFLLCIRGQHCPRF